MELFHAHIYFSENEAFLAKRVRDSLIYVAPQLTYVSDLILSPTGPHLKSRFEVHIPSKNIHTVAYIIDRKREGLSVLIHPAQEDKLAAHTIFARWFGDRLRLDLEAL